MKEHNFTIMHLLKFLVDANFYVSVLFLLYGAFTAISQNYAIFEFNEDLFGVMHTNLRMTLLYLGMTEVVVLLYCYLTRQPRLLIFVGYFLILMLGSLAFYGKINTIPIDENLHLFFLYAGVSHLLFGLAAGVDLDDAGAKLSGHGSHKAD